MGRIIRKADNAALLEAGEEKSLLADGKEKASESTDSKAADSKADENKPADIKPADSKPADNKSTDSKPVKDIDKQIAEIDREFSELGIDTSDGKDTKSKKPTLFCPECGAKLVEGAAFCMKCGKKLG